MGPKGPGRKRGKRGKRGNCIPRFPRFPRLPPFRFPVNTHFKIVEINFFEVLDFTMIINISEISGKYKPIYSYGQFAVQDSAEKLWQIINHSFSRFFVIVRHKFKAKCCY